MESGDTDGAKDHLIEVLRLNATDAWGWVVLGNLNIASQKDWAIGEKFLRRALEIAPNDPWALNGMATVTMHRGQTEDAVRMFEQAFAAKPDYPNPYHGLAVTLHRAGKPDLAARALDRLFLSTRALDARSRQVFDQTRALYDALQDDLMKEQHSEAFKAVENLRAGLELLSGYPVRVTEGEFKDKTTATIQMAWKYGRDYHLIKHRAGMAEDLLTHQMAHELTHLQMEAEARKADKNRFLTTTDQTEKAVLQRLDGDIRKLRQSGFAADASQNLVTALIRGLAGFLFNCPLDILIETRLRERMPVLAAAQFVALRMGIRDALESNTHPKVLAVTPKSILRAGLALNGAHCLFVDELYRGATNYTAQYQMSGVFPISQRFFLHWRARFPSLGPGDEYSLVDEFAEMVGLRGWYEWKVDPGTHTVTDPSRKEGTTNPGLLKLKETPAVYFLLDALKRYDKMPVQKIREITMEVGLIGRDGLDYASPDQKYTLQSLPGEKLSGLNLMCLMFAGFKRIAPGHNLQMDLHEPFLVALEMFEAGQTGSGESKP